MNLILKVAFDDEMKIARGHYRDKRWKECFSHLERAHVLGQRNAVRHTINHWWMLKVGFRQRNGREILGQIVRITVAGIGSAIGRVPIGNTGGANVKILQVMSIPADLQAIFDAASTQ